MTTPVPDARTAVLLAAAVLPRQHRERYRIELVGELYGLPPGAQRRHAAHVLARALSLRRVLLDQPGPPDPPASRPASEAPRHRARRPRRSSGQSMTTPVDRTVSAR